MQRKKTNKKYSPELKLKVVEEYLSSKGSSVFIADKYALSSGKRVLVWVKQYKKYGEKYFYTETRGKTTKAENPKKGRPKKYEKILSTEEKIKFLEMENAVLKKVMALRQKSGEPKNIL